MIPIDAESSFTKSLKKIRFAAIRKRDLVKTLQN